MQIVYLGPFDEVDVPALDMVVPRDTPILVDDEQGEQLCQQDCWELAKPAGKARKDASNKSEETS